MLPLYLSSLCSQSFLWGRSPKAEKGGTVRHCHRKTKQISRCKELGHRKNKIILHWGAKTRFRTNRQNWYRHTFYIYSKCLLTKYVITCGIDLQLILFLV